MSEGFVTIVSGLPRSGTSLMMQMLAAGGLPILSDGTRAPDESNPRGYLELEAVKHLRTDRSWLEQARGHAVKIIHLLLRELPTDGSFHYRVLLMKRPLAEVIASQGAMLARNGKAGADPSGLAKIFEGQLAEVERWLTEQPHFTCHPIDYHAALRDPIATADRIEGFLRQKLNTVAMAEAIYPALYRQRQNLF